MGLVRLTNSGTEPFIGMYDGRRYVLENKPDAFLIVDENIAKHWFGDWDLRDDAEKDRERVRVEMLNKPRAGWKIDVQRIIEQKKVEDKAIPKENKSVVINDKINPPSDEKEFEDLSQLTDTRKKPVSGKK